METSKVHPAIAALKNRKESYKHDDFKTCVQLCIDSIQDILTVETAQHLSDFDKMRSANQWTDVKDRLPELNQSVFFYYGYRPLIGTYKNDGNFLCSEDNELWSVKEDQITYWMPLPEPPATNALTPSGEKLK